jgi:serine carboxypeptidase-like clade 2
MAGSWRAAALAAAMVGWVVSSCVVGFPVEDLVTRMPGQPAVGFRQFAGYVDVDDKAGRSLFYYFTEAQDGAAGKPLTLWLNGGPYLLSTAASYLLFSVLCSWTVSFVFL